MDKLKNMFHSGGKKDDDTSYGDSHARRESASKATHQPAPTLHTTEDGHKKDHSILRQVVNPGDDKYDEQRYGSTATTQAPDPNQMQTHPEHQKDHTVLGQILNPNNEKYNERMFNETGATGGDRTGSATAHPEPQTFPKTAQLETKPGEEKKEHTILRQMLNPHGDKYDQQAFGQNAAAEGGSSSAAGPSGRQPHMASGAAALKSIQLTGSSYSDYPAHRDAQSSYTQPSPAVAGTQTSANDDAESCSSVKSGIEGPYARKADASGPGTVTSSTLPDRSTQSTMEDNPHLGRDAAIAGGAGAAGVGAYGAAKNPYLQETTTRGPMSTTTTTTTTTTSGPHTQQSRVAQPQSTQDSHFGRDAAIAGGVGAASAGAYGASQYKSPHQERQEASGAAAHGAAGIAPEDQGVKTAYDDGSHLGRNTAMAGGLAGAGAAGAGAYGASQHNKQDDPSKVTDRPHPLGGNQATTHVDPINPPEDTDRLAASQPGQSRLGRDTAIAGGLVGAGGASAYAGAQHNNLHNDPNTKVTDRPHPLHGHGTGAHINPVNAPETAGAGSTPQHGSHLGRDAALAGGAGLAGGAAASQLPDRNHPIGGTGAGTYSSTNDRALGQGPTDDARTSTGAQHLGTGPSSAPVEQLNQAPADVQNATYTARAYPLGTSHPTSGPHQTDAANILDPHVPGEFPTETGEDRHAVNELGLRSGALGGSMSSAQPPGQSSQHTGRDAAVAGGLLGAGAGAGGVAAYSMSNRDASGQAPPLASAAATGHPDGQGYPTSAGASAGPMPSTTGQSGSQYNYARDAALLGGTGAAGVGAYEVGKNRDDGTSPDTGRLHERNVAGVDPSMQREAEELKAGKDNEHHYGRDAAIAGGTGAAGVGAYELAKDRNEPSKHTGPHETSVANASDSRVQTQPENLKSVNKPNEPSMAGQDTQQQHHYGRDAAVAGGAGAAGAGAYDAAKQGPPPSNLAKGGDPTIDASKHPAETWDPKKIVEKQKEINQEQDEAAKKAAQRAGEKQQASYADKAHDENQDKKFQKQQKKDDDGDEKEKKPGLIARIMHPGRKSDEAGDEKPRESSGSNISGDNRVSEDDKGHHKLHKKGVEQQPMNTEKYGMGAGGTDGSQQMSGYHPHETGQGPGEQGVAGPDWNAIKKSNTPY